MKATSENTPIIGEKPCAEALPSHRKKYIPWKLLEKAKHMLYWTHVYKNLRNTFQIIYGSLNATHTAKTSNTLLKGIYINGHLWLMTRAATL